MTQPHGPPEEYPRIVQALSGVGLAIGFIAGYIYFGNFGWAIVCGIGGAGVPVIIAMALYLAGAFLAIALILGLFFGALWVAAFLLGAI